MSCGLISNLAMFFLIRRYSFLLSISYILHLRKLFCANFQNYNYSGAQERNSSFGFFGLAMCVSKNQMCYGAVGYSDCSF